MADKDGVAEADVALGDADLSVGLFHAGTEQGKGCGVDSRHVAREDEEGGGSRGVSGQDGGQGDLY